MKKRVISVVLVLVLCLSLLPVSALAAGTLASGSLNGTATWEISADGTKLTIHGGTTGGYTYTVGTVAGNPNHKGWPWEIYAGNITEVVFDGELTASGSLAGMFSHFSNLVSLDTRAINTADVTDMGNMFYQCSKLTYLDVSGFNTSKVTDMNGMFSGKMTSLNVSNFNTSEVTNMSGMFGNCNNLTSLDLSGFDTSKVTNMSWMFGYCYALSSLDISRFNTSNVTSMRYMFQDCRSLTTLSLRNFNTENVENMENMFSNCTSLTRIDLSSFNTSNVTTMSSMFTACRQLTEIDLSNFDTSNVTTMSGMFMFCENLESLDISGFDTSSTSSMNAMFDSCFKLSSIKLSEKYQFNGNNISDRNLLALLPDAPIESPYNGKWEFESNMNVNKQYTTAEMQEINPQVQTAGIYVWAKNIHSVYFIADDTEISTVQFKEGATSVEEPAVPIKTHYTGAWESYTVANAIADITVNAIYTMSAHDYRLNREKSKAATINEAGYDYYECSIDPAHFYTLPLAALKVTTHTATFQIGDTVIAQIVFEEGAASLEEPAIPERANYVGAWRPYDLAAATTDITIEGYYTPVDPDAVSDIEAGATYEYADSVVTINLSAAAATRTIKVTSTQARPVDVVLVLDQSGSMSDSLGASQSKRDALVNCANDFVRQLYENAVATDADHRVALVGFAYGAYNNGRYVNTGLLTTTSGQAVNYANLTTNSYQNALLSINNGGTINSNIENGINSIVANGATSADLGLKIANNIFANNPTDGKRERIVIFITDGTPTWWGETASLVRQTAAGAITEAKTLKNAQGAKIYSIGVEAGANPNAAFTSVADGVSVDARGNFVSYDFNRFLHAVSSNYPDAAGMSEDALGTGDKGAGYYMGVTDTGRLGNIFTNILYNTVYELKTFDKATLYYTLSKDFTLTIEQELALRDQLKEQGLTDADITITRNEGDGTTTLRFKNVKAEEVTRNGALCYLATVSFKATANRSASGETATGTSSGASYEGAKDVAIKPVTVDVSKDRKLIAFTINGQTYRIVEAKLGDTITVPESSLAKWTVDGATITGNYAEFEASEINDTFGIRWVIGNTEIVQKYSVGQKVAPPEDEAKAAAAANLEFTGWSPSAPSTMPAYSMVCTAIYSPAHVHKYVESYKSGTCDTGITTYSICSCGDIKAEKATAKAHNYTAVLSDSGSAGTTVEKLVCKDCGHAEEKNVTFKVSYSQSFRTTILDLNLYENNVSVSQPTQDIEMRFYIGDYSNRRYTVTRVDSDGTRTSYTTTLQNGYLVFDANHFSIYMLSEAEADGKTPVEEISYSESLQLLRDAQPVVDDTPLAENENVVVGYTITFDANGGSVTPASATTGADGKLASLPTPMRSSYSFSGWYTQVSGGTAVTTATAFNSDATIYAHWSYTGGSNTGDDGGSGGYVGSGPATTTPATPATTTETAADGTIIETTKNADGSVITKSTTTNGTTATTVTDARGVLLSATATVSQAALDTARATGDPIRVPITVVPARAGDLDAAAVLSLALPELGRDNGKMRVSAMPKVEIEVTQKGPGIIAMLRGADGKLSIIKECYEGSVIVPVDGDCELVIVDNTKSFADVDSGKWYTNAAIFVAAREIFNGTDLGFEPGGTMTRAMVAQILYNFDRDSEAGIMNTFADVNDSDWYADAVAWAARDGYIEGDGTSYRPTGAITRQDLVTILYRYAEQAGYDVSVTADLSAYADSADISAYAQDATSWAVGLGIIEGYEDNTVRPTDAATRAEVAAIMMRFCEKVQ